MINIIKKYWPLIIAIGLLWVTITVLLIVSVRQNHGHLVYALDDPYIHMAIAKNFSQHGVWGINNHEFTSSSSSLLWTLLLSFIYFLFGVNDAIPLVLNCIFGTLIIFGVFHLFRKYSIRPLYILTGLLATILFTPLPTLIFCGQEHTMHALLTILFVYCSAKILSDEQSAPKENLIVLIVTPLLTMARYEGFFLVIVVCILFALRKRLVQSIVLGVLGVLPIVIYGVFSLTHGWYFFPNSVLLKSNLPSLSMLGMAKFLYHFCVRMVASKDILFLLAVALFLFIVHRNKRRNFWDDSLIMLAIFIATTLLHMLFASAGWFYRYEAYLVALGIVVIVIAMREYLPETLTGVFDKSFMPRNVAILFFFLIMISPLLERGAVSFVRTPQATTNIYEQQYQMGLFLHRFYEGENVAANDIGVINYLADIRCLDLVGLGSIEVAKAIRDGEYTTQKIRDGTNQRKITIAILYEHWFTQYGGIPPEWNNVGSWTISKNVVCGGDTVSFYAVDPSKRDNLIENLNTFSSSLPENVIQSGDYTK